ncbi:MAG: AAA family ATPase [Candidatus Saccharibacteria bacterium]|nr:AAA family ATPase [Candidatus Saccharibacteria bacterium]
MDNKEQWHPIEEKIEEEYREGATRRAEKLSRHSIDQAVASGWEAVEAMRDQFQKNPEATSHDASESRPKISVMMLLSRIRAKEESARTQTVNTESTSDSPEISPAEQAMRKLIRENFVGAFREYQHATSIRDMVKLGLSDMNEITSTSNSRNTYTDETHHQGNLATDRLETLKTSSPEAHTLYYGLQLRDYARSLRNGELVVTPYVSEHLDRVEHNIRDGLPTFLHGHLGSGKTELAITAARHAAISRAAYESAEEDVTKFYFEHPDVSAQELLNETMRSYRRHERDFTSALRDGDPAAIEQFAPLIISGSKDLTAQDLYTDKTLKLTKFNGKPLLEHKEDLDTEITHWQEEHSAELDALAPEQRLEKERAAANEILELYKLKNQAFGTEVETIKQALYRGVEEGRPVIIDEVNAIPSAVLISMNDILQRRPGQTCFIPGVGQTPIKPGFAIIMTGNLDSSDVTYSGTNELNPAFLSRPDIIEHGYLPMSITDRGYESQVNPEKNELFQVITSYLVDRQGNLQLPEMDESLNKLFSLCQFAHESQLVFEGKWRESSAAGVKTQSGATVEPHLKDSVLSIRNILRVLREWDKGSEKDLDKALWDGFFAGITTADDQNFLLGLAKNHGFFQPSDGYQATVQEYGSALLSFNDIHPEPYNYTPRPLETLSTAETVDILFGPRPEREVYPGFNFDSLNELSEEFTIDDLEEAQEKVKEIKTAISALEVLAEQCGCDTSTPGETS